MPEIVLGLCALLQGLLLLFPSRPANQKAVEFFSIAGFLASAVVLITPNTDTLVLFGMLEDQPLLRLPRAALFLAALLLGRNLVSTKEIPSGRKREALFLLSLLTLFCDLLVLSRHALLSDVLLISLSWFGLFLSGLAYRGRQEGEAVLKYWAQASVLIACCLGAALVLAFVAGGSLYEVIGSHLKSLPSFSPDSLLVILSLCLPFFLAGGIFPFHFALMDRDHGTPWAVQLILGVMVQGAIALSTWKMGVMVFGGALHGASIVEGMRVLQVAGLIGGFWLALFALSQENSKRLFSALVGMQWFVLLGAGAMPSMLGVTAITYAFASAFLWSALLGFTWSRLQEMSGGDQMQNVYGAARAIRAAGLVLLVALAAPLCVPGFSGLPAVFHLLATMIEQRSLVFLLAEGLLLALLCLVCLRVGTDLLFRPRSAAFTQPIALRYGALDYGAMALLGAALLVLGCLWNPVFASLGESAKLFLN